MLNFFTLRAVQTVTLICTILLVAFPARQVTNASVIRASSSPAVSAPPTISHLNEPADHFTETNGVVDAKLYEAPVGISSDPATDTWHVRRPILIASPTSATTLDVTDLPFSESVDNTNPEADLIAEDGTTLHVAVRNAGTDTPIRSVLVGTSAVTYTTSLSGTTTNFTLVPTITGMAARVSIPSAAAIAVQVVLTTTVSQQASITQSVDGSVVVSHPQQECGDSGCVTVTAPAFTIESPTVDDSGTVSTTVEPDPITMQVASTGDQATITLTPNPAWLALPTRKFPVTFELPINTAAAQAETGTFSTVSSCAPLSTFASDAVVVGTVGACRYNAPLYFDVRQLWYLNGYTVTNAALQLYTPNLSGPSGISVYPNAPGAMLPAPPAPKAPPTGVPVPHPTQTQPPLPPLPASPVIQNHPVLTWNTAPTIAPNTDAVQTIGDNGHWHAWDLTTQVQQWLAHVQANTGVTLEGTGTPVIIASLLDQNNSDPATLPYLEVTLAPQPQVTQSTSHTGATMPAVSPCTSGTCTYSDESNFPFGVNGEVAVPGGFPASATNQQQLANTDLDAGTFRFAAEEYPYTQPYMPCGDGSYSDPLNAWKYTYAEMQTAYNNHLIPVVTFVQNNSCVVGGVDTTDWYYALAIFAYYMPNFGSVCIGAGGPFTCSTNPPMYIEIGNEVDSSVGTPYVDTNPTLYAYDFENAAQGINNFLPLLYGVHPAYTNFHILTDGTIAPNDGQPGCTGSLTNLNTAEMALYDAAYGTYPVPPQYLGTAVHPYGYETNQQETGYWRNFGQFQTNNLCTNLNYMITAWRSAMNLELPTQSQSPLVFTEINWAAATGLCMSGSDVIPREGSYQMDLFTWLYDHDGHSGQINFPIRTIWFEERDDLTSPTCPTTPPALGVFGPGSTYPSPTLKLMVSPYIQNTLFGPTYHYFSCADMAGGLTLWDQWLSTIFVLTSQTPCY